MRVCVCFVNIITSSNLYDEDPFPFILTHANALARNDAKPSPLRVLPLLLDRSGRVEITDFSVSWQLANSVSSCVSTLGRNHVGTCPREDQRE